MYSIALALPWGGGGAGPYIILLTYENECAANELI